MYFNDKNEINERRKQLAGQLNNGTQMYVNKRLPKVVTEIQENCNQLGLVSNSENCVSKIFWKKPEGGLFGQEVKLVPTVEEIADAVIKNKEKEIVHDDTNSVHGGKSPCRKKIMTTPTGETGRKGSNGGFD